MNHYYEAPESAKHWSGYDPSDPPHEEPPEDVVECDCGHSAHEDSTREVNARVFCPKCEPSFWDWLNHALDAVVAWLGRWFK